jgi:hypothetical protein
MALGESLVCSLGPGTSAPTAVSVARRQVVVAASHCAQQQALAGQELMQAASVPAELLVSRPVTALLVMLK